MGKCLSQRRDPSSDLLVLLLVGDVAGRVGVVAGEDAVLEVLETLGAGLHGLAVQDATLDPFVELFGSEG